MDRTQDTPQERTRNGANGGATKTKVPKEVATPPPRAAAQPRLVPQRRRGRTGVILVILLAGSLAVNFFQYQNRQLLEADLGTAVVAAQAQTARAQGELAALRTALGSVNERVTSLRDALGELAAVTAEELAAADARASRSPQIFAAPRVPTVAGIGAPAAPQAPRTAAANVQSGAKQGQIPIANWIRDWMARARAAWASQG